MEHLKAKESSSKIFKVVKPEELHKNFGVVVAKFQGVMLRSNGYLTCTRGGYPIVTCTASGLTLDD